MAPRKPHEAINAQRAMYLETRKFTILLAILLALRFIYSIRIQSVTTSVRVTRGKRKMRNSS